MRRRALIGVALAAIAGASLGSALRTGSTELLPDTSDTAAFIATTTAIDCMSDSPSPVLDFDELIPGPLGTLADTLTNCPDGVNTTSPFMAFVGGGGQFNFSTAAAGGQIPTVCSISSGLDPTDVDGPLTGEPNAPCSISSGGTGRYSNVVCGTAIYTGELIIHEQDPDGYVATYFIPTVGGHGPVIGTVIGDSGEPPLNISDDFSDMLSGWVTIVPAPGATPPVCMASASVIGSLDITSPS